MHTGLIHFIKKESNRTGCKIPIASIIAGTSNGPTIVVINEDSRYYAEPKRQGKTVIAATRDDRYFHVAGGIVKMNCGSIVEGSDRTV